MYFDTHAHYDDESFAADRDAVLSSLPGKGVELVLNPGCSLESSAASVRLAEKYPFLYAAAGIHPDAAETASEEALEELLRLARHPRVRAIGEIGLDYHYEPETKEAQQRAFRAQLALARSLGLPAIVHDREAHGDAMAIVREFPGVRGVFHCFSGSAETAKELVRLGWSISFTGALTFKNARRAAEALLAVPRERVMLETDSPYMSPEPLRGRRNDSSTLPHIAARAAELWGIAPEEAAALTLENGKRFFGIE